LTSLTVASMGMINVLPAKRGRCTTRLNSACMARVALGTVLYTRYTELRNLHSRQTRGEFTKQRRFHWGLRILYVPEEAARPNVEFAARHSCSWRRHCSTEKAGNPLRKRSWGRCASEEANWEMTGVGDQPHKGFLSEQSDLDTHGFF
jgi:hypothetical protein